MLQQRAFAKGWTGGNNTISVEKINLKKGAYTLLVVDPDAGANRPRAILKKVAQQYCVILIAPAAIDLKVIRTRGKDWPMIESIKRGGGGTSF